MHEIKIYMYVNTSSDSSLAAESAIAEKFEDRSAARAKAVVVDVWLLIALELFDCIDECCSF